MLFTHMGKKNGGETKNCQDKDRPKTVNRRPIEPGYIAQPLFAVPKKDFTVFVEGLMVHKGDFQQEV